MNFCVMSGALGLYRDALGPEVRDCAFRDPSGSRVRIAQA